MILPSIGFQDFSNPGLGPGMDRFGPGMMGDPLALLNDPIVQGLIEQHGITALLANPEMVEQALLQQQAVPPGAAGPVGFPLATEAPAQVEQGGVPNLFSALTQGGAGILSAPTGQFTQGLGAGFGAFGGTLDKLDQADRTSEIAEDRNAIARERNDIYSGQNAAAKLRVAGEIEARAKARERQKVIDDRALRKDETDAAALERDALEIQETSAAVIEHRMFPHLGVDADKVPGMSLTKINSLLKKEIDMENKSPEDEKEVKPPNTAKLRADLHKEAEDMFDKHVLEQKALGVGIDEDQEEMIRPILMGKFMEQLLATNLYYAPLTPGGQTAGDTRPPIGIGPLS